MVLPIFLSSLLGNGLVSKGINGLAQGGGFGLGYGFMVRAGYDLYGAMKDKLVGQLQQTRYSPDTALSMAGTGGLMGLAHAERKDTAQPDTQTLNRLSALHGKSNAMNVWRNHYQNKPQAPQQSTKNPIHIRTGREMSDWYYNNVYLVNKRNDRIKFRNRNSHRHAFMGLSRIA